MTKQDFKLYRHFYRVTVRSDLRHYLRLAKERSYFDEDAEKAYAYYYKGLSDFAALVGCTIPQACDILNLETVEV